MSDSDQDDEQQPRRKQRVVRLVVSGGDVQEVDPPAFDAYVKVLRARYEPHPASRVTLHPFDRDTSPPSSHTKTAGVPSLHPQGGARMDPGRSTGCRPCRKTTMRFRVCVCVHVDFGQQPAGAAASLCSALPDCTVARLPSGRTTA